MKVLVLAAEAAPFAKVGGLADVAGALPKALHNVGVDARLLIPRYGHISNKDYDLQRVGPSITVPVGPGQERVHLFETAVDGVPVYMLWDEKYLSTRQKVYGFNDDARRFAFFSRAIISAMQVLEWKPDVVHAHDWHTAPVVAWLDVYGRKEAFLKEIATLFTIHNLAYQGTCGRLILTFAHMQDLAHLPSEPPGQVNWMAQGIAHADLISVASPTYSRDILTPEAGMGLDRLLFTRRDRLFGILNGIDNEIWDPKTDSALTQTFAVDSLKMRAVNKTALQREMGLTDRADVPMLGAVFRLDPLKGLDILLPALQALLGELDMQFVLLGTGEEAYETQFRNLQQAFPRRVRVFTKFDERLARRIYGGVDLFVAPSKFEPGGMSHMIAMRYGAVPIVRATGVLADTVLDLDAQPARGTGFVFASYTSEALEDALRRALGVYRDKARWSDVQRRAMEMDFSWEASTQAYLDLYRRARALH